MASEPSTASSTRSLRNILVVSWHGYRLHPRPEVWFHDRAGERHRRGWRSGPDEICFRAETRTGSPRLLSLSNWIVCGTFHHPRPWTALSSTLGGKKRLEDSARTSGLPDCLLPTQNRTLQLCDLQVFRKSDFFFRCGDRQRAALRHCSRIDDQVHDENFDLRTSTSTGIGSGDSEICNSTQSESKRRTTVHILITTARMAGHPDVSG